MGYEEVAFARRGEGCEQAIASVSREDSALPDVSEAHEAPLPGSGRR